MILSIVAFLVAILHASSRPVANEYNIIPKEQSYTTRISHHDGFVETIMDTNTDDRDNEGTIGFSHQSRNGCSKKRVKCTNQNPRTNSAIPAYGSLLAVPIGLASQTTTPPLI
jgi:hypothetical protein